MALKCVTLLIVNGAFICHIVNLEDFKRNKIHSVVHQKINCNRYREKGKKGRESGEGVSGERRKRKGRGRGAQIAWGEGRTERRDWTETREGRGSECGEKERGPAPSWKPAHS